MKIKCEVCLQDFDSYGTGHFLHPTNWSALNKRTADVCSADCKDLFVRKIHAELDLEVVQTLIQNKQAKNDDVQTLHTIRDILDNSKLTTAEKLERLEEIFLVFRDDDWG